MTSRERTSPFTEPLDLTGFETKPTAPTVIKSEVKEAAMRSGFTARHAPQKSVPVSGRSLRRSNKTAQLNVAVSEEIRERFWTLAQECDCTTGEDLVKMLLDKFEGKEQRV